jgi:hypothetical protein
MQGSGRNHQIVSGSACAIVTVASHANSWFPIPAFPFEAFSWIHTTETTGPEISLQIKVLLSRPLVPGRRLTY